MKRFAALLLSLAMLLALTACGGNDTGKNSNSTAQGGTTVGSDGSVVTKYDEADTQIDEDLPHYNILVIYYSFTDKLGSQYKSSLEYVADTFNIEFTFCEAGYGENTQNIVEAALVNKPDAVISNYCSVSLLKAAADAGNIPFVVCGTVFSSDENAQEMAAYDNFLGCIGVNDYQAGWDAAESLYRDGCRNVLLCGVQKGISGQHDQRAYGFLDYVESADEMNLIGDVYTMGESAAAISSYAATYPELDGVFCTGMGESIYNTFTTENLIGSVKLAGIDITESTGESFENGLLSYMAGGNYVTNMLGFVTVYNYLMDGTRIIENTAEYVKWNNINLNSTEDYNNYIQYLDSGTPAYTAAEIKNMIHYFNADVNGSFFLNQSTAFTLEDVVSRHKDIA